MNTLDHGGAGFGGGLIPQGPKLSSEINVTPFVDVMLVLLIIFMISAPMLTVGVPVDLPKASLNPLPPEQKPLDVSIQSDGTVHVGDEASTLAGLASQSQVLEALKNQTRVRLRADAKVPYEQVVAVIESLAAAGITQVGLIARAKPQEAGP